jgi:hypothetical protein
MNGHRHWVLSLVDNDNTREGIKDRAASSPGWQDRRQTIFPASPVLGECAEDYFIGQNLISCA